LTAIDFTDVISCEFVGHMGGDLSVVNAARISFDHEHPEMQEGDDKLIHWLLSKRHGSPFEHNFFKFKVEAPIFTFREHHRHRVGHSYNEMSARYTELEPKFYVPQCARVQHGKPGAYFYIEEEYDAPLSRFLASSLTYSYRTSWSVYQSLLERGIAKEQARMVLPVGIFTKMIWSCNARSLMHFLGLRAEKSAQKEIQTVAYAAEAALEENMPITYEAFIENGRVAP
jgi:thymidylate synthase (FAD)